MYAAKSTDVRIAGLRQSRDLIRKGKISSKQSLNCEQSVWYRERRCLSWNVAAKVRWGKIQFWKSWEWVN